MVGEVIFYHGNWGLQDQISFKTTCSSRWRATLGSPAWPGGQELGGTRGDTLAAPWTSSVLVTAQQAPSVPLVFVDFPDSEVDVSAMHCKNTPPALHGEQTLPVAKFTLNHSPTNAASIWGVKSTGQIRLFYGDLQANSTEENVTIALWSEVDGSCAGILSTSSGNCLV